MNRHFCGLLSLLLVLAILINRSSQQNEDPFIYSRPSSMAGNDTTETIDEPASNINPINHQSIETRSNVMNVIENFNNLRHKNPHLLQKYISEKQDHIFNDIWRRFSNMTTNTNDTSNNNNNNVYEVEWQPTIQNNDDVDNDVYRVLSSSSSPDFHQDSMSAHETQTQDHKDQLTKLIPTSATANDVKNNDNKLLLPVGISHRRGQYVPSNANVNRFQEYLSCCEQLFNKYGDRNYIHEDIFMIPESEPYLPVALDGPGPPVLVTEYPPTTSNKRSPTALYSHSLHNIPNYVNDDDIKIDSPLTPLNLKDFYPKTHRHSIECLDDGHHHHHRDKNHDHHHQHYGHLATTPVTGQLISTHPYDSNPQTNSKVSWMPIRSIEQQPPMPITVHRIVSTSIPAGRIIGSTGNNGLIRPFTSMNPASFNEIVNNPSTHDSSSGPISTKTTIPFKHPIPLPPPPPSYVTHQPGIIPISMGPVPHNHHHYRLNQWPFDTVPPPIRSMVGTSTPHSSSSGILSKKLSLLGKKYLLG